MLRNMMRAKIHHAKVTQCDLNYVGSITIDADLLRAVDLRPNELVHVLDIDNGARLETYVFKGEPGSGIIGINGAAARLVNKGDKVIIVAFGIVSPEEIDKHESRTIVLDDSNKIVKTVTQKSVLDEPATIGTD